VHLIWKKREKKKSIAISGMRNLNTSKKLQSKQAPKSGFSKKVQL